MFVSTISQAQSTPADRSSSASRADKPEVPTDSDAGFANRNPRYVLRSGDSFDVEFTFSPEFNQTVVVGPDGYVTFRGAASRHVAGQTVPQLTDTIKEAYSGILSDPTITVVLKDFEKPYFIAAGQVEKPGKYELRSDLSLVEAVNIAGGFTDASKHSQVLLFRRVSDGVVETRVFDIKKMLALRNLQEDPHLLPGDMVFVPQNFISKIRRYLPTSSLGLYANPLIP
ncbi:MAG TPA: polysaccharide biosynthesis/export family protein [Verrucomicrobiae bacterium]|nr:polysaccharide biosynthesis/export family protein [Verrucomicrobiae bacterium]